MLNIITNMMRLRLTVFCAVLVTAGFITVNALTDEDRAKISKSFGVHISSCSKERGISEEDIKSTGKANTIDPCVAECLLTKTKIIDESGKWDVNRAYQLNEAFFGSVAKDLTKEKLMNNCDSIKDIEFGKGDESCKMANAVFECSMPFQERLLVFN